MLGTVRLLVLFALLGMLVALATAPASAAEYTNVAGLEQWSAESNYMSLAGYLRWMTFREQGIWLSMPEAQRIVAQQKMEME
jgi:hypothetical protein